MRDASDLAKLVRRKIGQSEGKCVKIIDNKKSIEAEVATKRARRAMQA